MTPTNGETLSAPSSSSSSRPGDLVDFKDVVRFFRRHWAAIFGMALLAAAATMGYLSLFSEPVYEASAMLVVLPPRFSSELTPKPLTLQGYQRLLESDGVVAETARRLTSQDLVEENGLRIGDHLDARIFVSRRAEEMPLAPVIEVVARARTPLKAAAVANVWSEVFLERVRELRAGSTLPAVDFIEQQYARQRSDLAELEEKKDATANDFQKTIDQTTLRWNRRIRQASLNWEKKLSEFSEETRSLLTGYHLESRETLQRFALELSLPDGKAEGEALSSAGVSPELRSSLLKLLNLRIQLAQTSELTVLRKAISDEALWQALMLSDDNFVDMGNMARSKLVSQEINPIHEELALRVSQLEIEVEDLAAGDVAWVRQLTAGMERLQRERSVGLAKLVAQRTLEGKDLESQRDLELRELNDQMEQAKSTLGRERSSVLGQLDRDLSQLTSLFKQLGDNHSQARLARAEQDLDEVRLAVAAVASSQPMPRGRVLKSLIVMLVVGFLGTLVSFVREVL